VSLGPTIGSGRKQLGSLEQQWGSPSVSWSARLATFRRTLFQDPAASKSLFGTLGATPSGDAKLTVGFSRSGLSSLKPRRGASVLQVRLQARWGLLGRFRCIGLLLRSWLPGPSLVELESTSRSFGASGATPSWALASDTKAPSRGFQASGVTPSWALALATNAARSLLGALANPAPSRCEVSCCALCSKLAPLRLARR